MKYKKGTVIKAYDETFLYSDQYIDDNDEIILVCVDRGNFVYIPETDTEIVETSVEDKTLLALMNVACSITRLNENVEEISDAMFGNETGCNCDNCKMEESDSIELN